MRKIGSFNNWKMLDKPLIENVQAAKQYMLKRFARDEKIEVSAISPEDQAKVFADEDYKAILQLVQSNPGYTSAFVKFRFDHNISIEELTVLFEKIKTNSQFLGELSMPVLEFPNKEKINGVLPFEALIDELYQIESRRKAKWIIADLPGRFRKEAKEISKENLQKLLNVGSILIDADKEIRERLMKGSGGISDLAYFIVYAEQFAKAWLNADIKKKLTLIVKLEPECSVLYSDGRYLAISVRTERAQKELCALGDWCINRGSFNSQNYGGGNVQLNIFDFDLPPSDAYHLTGTTITYEGNVTYSSDIDNRNIRKTGDMADHFKNLSYPDELIKTVIREFPMEASLKKLVTGLYLNNTPTIDVIKNLIMESYKAVTKVSIGDDKFIDILAKRINANKNEVIPIYIQYGIMSFLSAKLFNELLANSIDEETKSIIMEKTLSIFKMIKEISENPKIPANLYTPAMQNTNANREEILKLIR